MQCKATGLTKIYNHHVIFENFNYTFESGKNYVILGGNGSGKSTLLKIISGGSEQSEGQLSYRLNNTTIPSSEIFKHLSFCSPYLGLIEEFTFKELIDFQRKFKPFTQNLSTKEIVAISELENIKKKPIKNFSSGMKQRVRLLLAILADTPLLLLDEPVSNLDPKAKKWYKSILSKYASGKTIIVCSNFLEEEYPENPELIDLLTFKV